MNERRLKRAVVIGITLSRASLGEKRSLFRAMRDEAKWVQMREMIMSATSAAGYDIAAPEFDWTEFFEFLKWLIPLLLELIGGLEAQPVSE